MEHSRADPGEGCGSQALHGGADMWWSGASTESWRSVPARRGGGGRRQNQGSRRPLGPTRLIGGTEDEQLGSLRTRRGFQDHPGEQLEDNKQPSIYLTQVWCSDVGVKDVLKVICPETLGGSAAENLPD